MSIEFPIDLRLGYHIRTQKTMTDSVRYIIEKGLNCFQFYNGNPRGYSRKKIPSEDLDKANQILSRFPTFVSIHAPLVAYLANPKSFDSIRGDLELSSNFPDSGVVIHVGSYKTPTEIGKNINTILSVKHKRPYRILIENSAGQGHQVGNTLTELKEIYDQVQNKEEVCFCIDTCHLFAVGDYDLSKTKGIRSFFRDFDKMFDIKKLRLIHLNDSEKGYGERKDRHACLGEGKIWSESFDSLLILFDKCQKYNIPLVLETPNPVQDLIVIRELLQDKNDE